MPIRNAIRLFFLLCFSSSLSGQSGTSQPNFKTITKQDGLPSREVNYLLEDKMGFIWFATTDGLSRYDGREFKTFKATDSVPNGLQSSVILKVIEDHEGWLWAGTEGGGLSAYNRKEDRWHHWGEDSTMQNGFKYNIIASLTLDSDGSIWCSTQYFLHHISKTDTGFSFDTYEMEVFETHQKPLMIIHDICEGPDKKTLWLATARGVVGFDKGSKEFMYSEGQKANNDPAGAGRILLTSYGDFFVSMLQGGVARVSAKKIKPGIELQIDTVMPEVFNSINIREMEEVEPGRVFMSGHGLLSATRQKDGSLKKEHYNKVPNLANSLPHNVVKHTIIDRAGNWWAASHSGVGVHYAAAPQIEVINNLTLNDENFDNRIYRIFKDSKERLWFGGEDGLILMDPSRNQRERLVLYGQETTRPGFISGINEDSLGYIWVSVAPNLYKIDPATLRFSKYPIQYPRPEVNKIWIMNLAIDQRGLVWLPAIGGLPVFSPEKESWGYSRPEYLSYFYGLGFLSKDYFVTADNAFLYLLDANKATLQIIEKDGKGENNREPYLNGLKDMTLSDSVAYLATRDGLLTYDFRAELWKLYTTREGLPDNALRALAVDGKGYVWLATDLGIARFDPRKKKVETLITGEKLPCQEFYGRAGWASHGRVYFGCDNGLIHFEDNALTQNPYQPPLYITGISLFNKELSVGQPGGVKGMSMAPEFLESIELKHNQSVVTIRFAALNFNEPSQNQYSYRLLGFADEWIENATRNEATFTNLDPGEYTFEVKGSNNQGVWGAQLARLQLIVLPPWYKTWWAYLIYFGFFTAVIYFLWKVRLERLRHKLQLESRVAEARHMEREEFRSRSAADFHDEAGNKLTKISLFTSLAKEQQNGNPELNKYLFKIEQNTKELSAGMRDFLWVMDPARDSLFDTILRLQNFGDSMFGETHTRFVVKGLAEGFHRISLSMDARRAIIQIFKEGMNNCAKHACAEVLTLRVSLEGSKLRLCLEDDGQGFDLLLKNEGSYGRAIMQERAEKIGADLQTISGPGEGTKLCLDYEIPQMSDISG